MNDEFDQRDLYESEPEEPEMEQEPEPEPEPQPQPQPARPASVPVRREPPVEVAVELPATSSTGPTTLVGRGASTASALRSVRKQAGRLLKSRAVRQLASANPSLGLALKGLSIVSSPKVMRRLKKLKKLKFW